MSKQSLSDMTPSQLQRIDVTCDRFEAAWQIGQRPCIEDYLDVVSQQERSALLRELLSLELYYRYRIGEMLLLEEYQQRFPEHAELIQAVIEEKGSKGPIEGSGGEVEHPDYIDRYQIKKVLGKGSFGLVYLAHDQQLSRPVAIKVPHRNLMDRPEAVEAYRNEARTVANLDHPHIVPVFDVGSTDQFLCFVVSKYVDGMDLASRLKQSRLSLNEAVELVATIAEALHFAHNQGLVHRDIKPGNILLDKSGKPFVADFGLALREQDTGKGPRFAGTPAYMSPEQAGGEGHRVDGRSDVFSLGVIFYELLTGRRPFKADSQQELLEQIAGVEARPPRQVDDAIPKELERICLKAMAKRASERHTTAKDLAEDLLHFLSELSSSRKSTVTGQQHAVKVTTPTTSPNSDNQPIKIVPKGLRSFDAHDADFFLELLPDPRDREGLPDSIRFWKTRIEETDADNTFSVGLIYGPSGCGKSSFVKAGLLPRLSDNVIAVYVEATAEETETRLLNGLRKRCVSLPDNLGMKETLAALRQGRGISVGKKVLIVLDQFEQWLHAKKEEQNTELVQALRQCDGGGVQCIVLVRDDFWMATTRFLRELEIDLVAGRNTSVADLFDLRHTKKVLSAFGRAFGTLPEHAGELNAEQQAFVELAVSGLAQEGKVICVRLALFAEMMKSKAWTPGTLKEVGGTEGVGVAFLEEVFTSNKANPKHRLHQKAARAVLKSLLPASGTDIKGHMRSHQELLEASGYSSRPKDFDDLIRILDSEIRLITPIDPEGKDECSATSSKLGEKYYQLTHDYLVPSLRDWLTRKQKETRRGRAELQLADRAGVWNARPENRQLPSLLQWFSLHLLTAKKNWTPPQRKMMAKASRVHAVRGAVLASCLMLLGLIGWEANGRLQARTLRDRLLESTTADAPGVVKDMAPYRRWVNPLLQDAYAQAKTEKDSRKQLHASLALLPADSGQVEYLRGRLLKADPQELVVIREALQDHKADLMEGLWTLLENPRNNQDERFRAACALALFAPDDSRWDKVKGDVGATLVIQKPFVIAQWTDALKGVERWLIPPLAGFLVDEKRTVTERGLIGTVYGKYATDVPDAYSRLEKQLEEKIAADASFVAKETLVKKHASIGAALLVMGKNEKGWQSLKHSPDPTVRSYLIERLGPGGVDSNVLIDRLKEESEVLIKRAILLALGEFGQDRLSLAEQRNHLPWLRDLYHDDPDPGIHGAAEWLLGKWQTQDEMKENDKGLSIGKAEGNRQWYRNGQGQTMVVVAKPKFGEIWIDEGEQRQLRRIDWSFAIASKVLTVTQFRAFRKEQEPNRQYAPTDECPMNTVTWYDAAAYCNWLSEKEGITEDQWCYIPNKEKKYTEGMAIAANYWKLRGYRLPTEAEWEYACRAGAATDFSFGGPVDLLGRYGWSQENALGKSHPVGLMKPNDLGLFDMHGNLWEWCQDGYQSSSKEDSELYNKIVNANDFRVLRGGHYMIRAWEIRSSSRSGSAPGNRTNLFGFRLARTFIP